MTVFVFFSVVALLLYLQAGLFLFFRKPVVKVNRLFAFMLFALAWISFFILLIQFADNLSVVYLLDRINMFGYLAFPLLSLLFFERATRFGHQAIRPVIFIVGAIAAAIMVRYMLNPHSLKVFYEGASGMWYFEANIQSVWVVLAVLYNLACAFLVLFMVLNFFVQTIESHKRKATIQSRVFLISFFVFLIIGFSSHILFPLLGVTVFPAMIHLAALPMVGAIFLSIILLHPQTFFREMISRIFIRRIKEFVFFLDHNGLIYSANQYCLDELHYSLSDMANKEPGYFLRPSGMVAKKMEDAIMGYKTEDLVCLMIPAKGLPIPVSLSVTKVYDAFRNMIGFLLIASDYRQTKSLYKERGARLRSEQKLIRRNLELEEKIQKRCSALIDIQEKLNSEHKKQEEAEKQVREELRKKEDLLRELHHRVKNNIQMIISLINMEQGKTVTQRGSDSDYGSIANRMRTISMIHDYFYDTPYLGKINFRNFVDKVVGELRGIFVGKSYVQVNVSFERTVLPIDQAIPCGIIIFELLSNSLQHAFNNNDPEVAVHGNSAQIHLKVFSENNRLRIHLSDNGQGISLINRKPEKKNIGLRLVELLVDEYLYGTVVYANIKGASVQIDFELVEKQGL